MKDRFSYVIAMLCIAFVGAPESESGEEHVCRVSVVHAISGEVVREPVPVKVGTTLTEFTKIVGSGFSDRTGCSFVLPGTVNPITDDQLPGLLQETELTLQMVVEDCLPPSKASLFYPWMHSWPYDKGLIGIRSSLARESEPFQSIQPGKPSFTKDVINELDSRYKGIGWNLKMQLFDESEKCEVRIIYWRPDPQSTRIDRSELNDAQMILHNFDISEAWQGKTQDEIRLRFCGLVPFVQQYLTGGIQIQPKSGTPGDTPCWEFDSVPHTTREVLDLVFGDELPARFREFVAHQIIDPEAIVRLIMGTRSLKI